MFFSTLHNLCRLMLQLLKLASLGAVMSPSWKLGDCEF